jgi:hypothetical protein
MATNQKTPNPKTVKVQFFAVSRDGARREIGNLYWFEEEMIESFDYTPGYTLEIVVDGVSLGRPISGGKR